MAYGRVTKLDPVAVVKVPNIQKTSNECTDEELINAGKIVEQFTVY